MNKNRALVIGAGVIVVVLSWFAASSNGLGSAGAAATAAHLRPAPVLRAAQPAATSIDPARRAGRSQPAASMPVVIGASSGSGSWASYTFGTSGSSKATSYESGGGNGVDTRVVAGGDD